MSGKCWKRVFRYFRYRYNYNRGYKKWWYVWFKGLGRGLARRPSQPAANVITTPPVTTSDGSILVGAPNQDAALVQSFRTRRTKCLINFALEDFSRIHTHFSDRNRPGYIETPVYSFQENEKIKFQLRFVPSKHHMSAEVVYRGTDFSAQLLVDIYLVDINGKRFVHEILFTLLSVFIQTL